MTTEDRRKGKQLPVPVIPPDTICYTIHIPNAVQYRAALLGQLNILGEWHTWDHPTDGTECADCEEAAQLWRNAIAGASFSDDCEAIPMSCDDVADCIETSQAVQDAIADQIINNTTNTTNIYDTSNHGTPLTPGQRGQPISTSLDCEEDSLFGSVSEVVAQLDKNNRDFLEIIEVGTNTRERVSQVIAAIPVIETLPVNEIVDYVDKLQSEILENYEAQWTTAVFDTYRCELFCIALEKPDCILTFDDYFAYFEARVGASLDPSNFLQALIQYVILGTWAGTTVIDIMMVTQLGIMREASNWVGVSLRTLQTIGALGANNPDGDWEIIPCGCGDDTDCLDFRDSQHDWVPAPGGYGDWVSGQGWKGTFFAGDNKYYLLLVLPVNSLSGSYTKIRLKFNQAITDVRMENLNGQVFGDYTGAAATEIVFDSTTATAYDPVNGPFVFPTVNASNWYIKFLPTDTVPGSLRLQEICLEEE